MPTISIIIPVYNGERYLAEAIESVLTQTRRPEEILVIDDGSTDGTRKVAERFAENILYIAQTHQSAPAARNLGIRHASGDLLSFLDADDLWLEEKLARQINAFQNNPSLEASFCHLQNFISPDLSPEQAARFYCPLDPMPGYTLQTLLVKRTLFSKLGLLDTSLEVGDSVEWCQRVLNSTENVNLLEYVGVRRRIHGANLTHRRRTDANKNYLQLLKRTLDRKRAGSE